MVGQSTEDNDVRTERLGARGPPVGVEEDVNEGGGDGGQCFGVQREDTKAVLWTLDRMHRGVGPCWGEPGGGE